MKECNMRKTLKAITITLLLAFLLMIVACSTPPPPVSRDQLQTARNEAITAEESVNESLQEKRALEAELARKEAELRSLVEYERQLGL
jgi:septal ring factor EnvC (AmiA/AmiB activator)